MRLQLDPQHEPASESGWRRTWFDIIYRHDTRQRVCAGCGQGGHDPLAGYCRRCGRPLPPPAG